MTENPLRDFAIAAGLDFPRMQRDAARRAGFELLEPGMPDGRVIRWGFTLEHWRPDSFLALHKMFVMIYIIHARRPGTGAFRRLVDAIRRDGIGVSVDTPIGAMPAIVRHMGFTPLKRLSGGQQVWVIDPIEVTTCRPH